MLIVEKTPGIHSQTIVNCFCGYFFRLQVEKGRVERWAVVFQEEARSCMSW
jgi:hypothetical protein